RYGLANLLISCALAGMLLFAMGALKLGGLVRYVPVSIVIGFTNGIAVLIALSQVKDFLGLSIDKMPSHFFDQLEAIWQNIDSINPSALAIGAISLGGLFLWTRLFSPGGLLPVRLLEGRTVRGAARLPGSIVALVSLSIATALFSLPVETIGSRFGGIPTVLPSLALPTISWQSAQQLFIPTITIAILGAVESLLCARVADNLTPLPRHDPNQELMAQGIANMVVPLFGGIPVTGTIARTVTNVRSGANSPVSGIVHAMTLLAIVLVAAPLAVHVPLAALAGILLFVAFNMGEWHEFRRLRQFSAGYRTILIGTFLLTVIFDLTVAIEIGLVLSCVFFIYRMSTLFQVQPAAADEQPAATGVVLFNLYGALFFGAVAAQRRGELPLDGRGPPPVGERARRARVQDGRDPDGAVGERRARARLGEGADPDHRGGRALVHDLAQRVVTGRKEPLALGARELVRGPVLRRRLDEQERAVVDHEEPSEEPRGGPEPLACPAPEAGPAHLGTPTV
ncbi:MAG TPA: SulP family inorganic anion transporter, partial [Phycisphaerae bacterium]|nr:SulP family inorganic anion transporter [Phycisphaerae bacterium]